MPHTSSRIRAYMGSSLDGYIAGPGNELDWLSADHARAGDLPASPDYLDYPGFIAGIGCLLMGRTTYEVVAAMPEWPYAGLPVLVASHRPLQDAPDGVQVAEGSIEVLVERARTLAAGRDVYVDGGAIIRQAVQAQLLDDLVLTWLPILLGGGVRLFDVLPEPVALQFSGAAAAGNGLLQVSARLLPQKNSSSNR
ncbi:dihydrofolate reductase family protein [Stenotrophomonas sp. WED208]|uniref:dihydrofolate reductase family protein n=1 Tax=Stenotrophomonas sp. WED208 TaxID=3112800 RepID=UPI002A9F82EE|nr:dihydrofolate reductase [Stenotrophomonas maltophilia]HEL3812923.1 dihydrofolate reductase [Stenotrophomonas maltophilia]